MADYLLFGADYSVYTRIPRLVLEEVGATYRLEPVDIFAEGGPPADYLERQPFAKIPALEHDGFRLFETDAIAHYIVETTGCDLVAEDEKTRARMRQIMRIADNYAYPALVWGVFVAEVDSGETLSADAITSARRVLDVIESLMVGEMMVGDRITLADLWLVPMIDYFGRAPSGQRLLADYPKITKWFAAMATRPSVMATAFPSD